jgi:xanthine dehydrogenase small subunit
MAKKKIKPSQTRPIRFMLNGTVVDVTPDHVDTTLLNWLRQFRHLTGSKEGCAEGDCGACSVIISRRHHDGRISHDAANACILFLPMLDGMVVTTIEHITGPNDELHPVQNAMINYHGSQCGFCTPGFVISMVAGWRQKMDWRRQNIEDLIAGNLCRCTGYGPIIAAAESLRDQSIPAWEADRLRREADWLHGHTTEPLMTGQDRLFCAPKTVDDLARAIAQNPSAQIIAGATDIGLWVTKQHQNLPGFISVMSVPELQMITENDDAFVIGCGVSHGTAKDYFAETFPQLNELWRRFGSTQVRATGTVCGNLANSSPIGDLPPAFLALGASLVIRHDGDERILPLDQFYHDYMVNDLKEGEWVKAVILPKPAGDNHLMIHKISRRFDQDISAVMGAFSYHITDGVIRSARIGFGGMAAVPARAKATEAALIGHSINAPPDDSILDKIDDDFTPISDVRASADYRLAVAKVLLTRSVITEDKNKPVMLAGSGMSTLNIEIEGAAE